MPELSVVLATINDSIACNLTCASIIAQLEADKVDYEIILIDNNSQPAEREILQSFLDYHQSVFPIQYYSFDISGTIPIHSFGVEKAKGKYIVMPEPHIILSPHYYKDLMISLELLKSEALGYKGIEAIFTPFNSGNVARRGDDYICGSPLISPNPFIRPGTMGISCKLGGRPFPILSNAFSGMICEREWLLKIGNMFPAAFKDAGGYCAESLLIGIATWMWGGKCYLDPNMSLEHPVYRRHKGAGRNEHLDYSMAVAGYILGGEDYISNPADFKDLVLKDPDILEARKFVQENAKITLKELVDNWETIKNA